MGIIFSLKFYEKNWEDEVKILFKEEVPSRGTLTDLKTGPTWIDWNSTRSSTRWGSGNPTYVCRMGEELAESSPAEKGVLVGEKLDMSLTYPCVGLIEAFQKLGQERGLINKGDKFSLSYPFLSSDKYCPWISCYALHQKEANDPRCKHFIAHLQSLNVTLTLANQASAAVKKAFRGSRAKCWLH